MSALPGTVPSSAAGLQDPNVALAYLEGHDADIPSNASANTTDKSIASSLYPDLEKGDDEVTSLDAGDPAHAKAEHHVQEQEQPDPNIVWWDEPADQDPKNPMNWSEKKKWSNIGVLAICTLIT